jgi:hypothetical protein
LENKTVRKTQSWSKARLVGQVGISNSRIREDLSEEKEQHNQGGDLREHLKGDLELKAVLGL